jgi:hypothetical protein
MLSKKKGSTYEKGGKVEYSQEESLKHFLIHQASSGMIANRVPYNDYSTIAKIRISAIEILNRDGDRKYSIQSFNDIIQEALLEYEENKFEGEFAKGGRLEDGLLKELHRLQRDLNSPRLMSYREDDTSEEEMARQNERAVKLARFNEVLMLLREADSKKYAQGGKTYEWATSTVNIFPIPSNRKAAEKKMQELKSEFPNARNFRIEEVPYSWGTDYRVLFDYERRKMEKGGSIDTYEFYDPFRYYIEYLNKDNGFKAERVYFDSYEEAAEWGTELLDNFHPDMVIMEKKMAQGGLVKDLFEDYENQPAEVSEILSEYEREDNTYSVLSELQKRLETETGYTFDYGLDAEPYGLRPLGVPLSQVEGFEDFDDDADDFEKGGTTSGEAIQEVIERINSKYDGVVASERYRDRRIQVVSPFFNTLNEIKRKEFGGSGLMERYGNTSSYVLYSNKSYYAKGGRLAKMHKDLKMGTEIEMEHKETIAKFKKKGMSDREVAMMIAADHLKEDPNYYRKMKKAGL